MMMQSDSEPLDWDEIELVVFDLDGTLYDQRRLRARMSLAILRQAVREGNSNLVKILRSFRACREGLASQPEVDFVERQYTMTAENCGCAEADVRASVHEWIERRPLAYLEACRYSGIRPLFEALTAAGKTVAVLSDYPAADKLNALGLTAELVASASDSDVRRLKPDPTGLRKVLRLAGATPARSVMIGDRVDRDGEVARRVGMRSLIKGGSRRGEQGRFRTYTDAVFQPVLMPLHRHCVERDGWQSGNSSFGLEGQEWAMLPSFERTVRALADTLVRQSSPARSADHVAAVSAYLMATHARMPDFLRLAFKVLTLSFDAWSYPSHRRPFHRLGFLERAAQIAAWEASRLESRRGLMMFYHSLAVFGLYSARDGTGTGVDPHG